MPDRMTQVEFHFNAPDKLAYACRLLRKAVGSGARLVVVADADTLARLDVQLWTFAPLEFVPHGRLDGPAEVRDASPVVLAPGLSAALPHREVLVNLGQTVVQGFADFVRVIEVVSFDEHDRQQARARWKAYTELGYALIRRDLNLK